jgi:hypothetical protein
LAVNFRYTTRIAPQGSITYNLEVRVNNSLLWLKVKQGGPETHTRELEIRVENEGLTKKSHGLGP